jgi:hypothetical protein
MKTKTIITALLMIFTLNITAQTQLTYTTIPTDLMKTRIYKLDNGLTVYLSVNKEKPRIQT